MKRTGKERVVIDTNLLISAVLTTGTPYNLIQAWKNDKFTLVLSPYLLKEIKDTSQKDYLQKYHLFSERAGLLIITLKLAAEIISPLSDETLPIHCRDPKDDQLLAVALTGDTDYLITGDKDLLELNGKKELGKLRIITAKEFLTYI